jgi:uncharacterized membrane protein HdeD (DUF308 family)
MTDAATSQDEALEFARGWWMFVLRGVLAIVYGILAWAWPGLTVSVMVIVLGAYVIADGGAMILNALLGRELTVVSRLLYVMAGLATIACGLIIWIWPGITARIVMILFGVWATVLGVGALALAVARRPSLAHAWLLGLIGLAAIVFGLVTIMRPGAGALSLVWLIATFSIVLGAFLIVFGFFMRAEKSELEHRQLGSPGLAGA